MQKAKNTTETIRINSMITDEKKQIDAEIYLVGKLYYETQGEQPELPFSEHVDNINAAKLRIAEYDRQITQSICCQH